jgi:hypothetical protein
MSGKPKHGKGKYAYQAKVSGKKQEQPAVGESSSAYTPVLPKYPDTQPVTVSTVPRAAVMTDGSAAVPASVKKIDLVFEMKRIGIIAAVILVLLVILSIMLK